MSGLHQSPGDLMIDICDGDIFKCHPILSNNDIILQMLAYYDEFTVANPLSPRAKKLKIG